MGDGRIHIRNMHTGKEASVNLINRDGTFDEDGFTKIDEVFGYPTEQKGEHISPRLIFMLNYFSNLLAPGKEIKLISGYRSPEYNTKLRDAGGQRCQDERARWTAWRSISVSTESAAERSGRPSRAWTAAASGITAGAAVHLDAGRPRFLGSIHIEGEDRSERL